MPEMITAFFHHLHAGSWRSSITGKRALEMPIGGHAIAIRMKWLVPATLRALLMNDG
ncbi:hypothetical protein [Ignatzschineria cameli]|uniref:hypothetical protein n=1 Tax=Ignatzschineria cameli TaxID=2182793 RepID=UPI0013005402|nr:hypothetical protein [Ignatzschineria cameli]